jgi:hypothetical protein
MISWFFSSIMASHLVVLLGIHGVLASGGPVVDLGYAVYQGSVQEVRRNTIDAATSLI